MKIIAERINGTRKAIRTAIQARDEAPLRQEIIQQTEAGAHFIDLNAGTGGGVAQEVADLKWLIDLALDATGKPLALDSSGPDVIQRAAEHLGNRRPWMLNSVKAEPAILEPLLPLAAEHNAAVVALAMGEGGIPATAEERLKNCATIAEAAEKAGVPLQNLYFDPLVLPLSADVTCGRVTLETLREIKARLAGARTVIGLSNVSHGLPKRRLINHEFLLAALTHGLDAAICDPTRPGLKRAVLLGDLIAGNDRYCRKFTRAARKGEL